MTFQSLSAIDLDLNKNRVIDQSEGQSMKNGYEGRMNSRLKLYVSTYDIANRLACDG